MSGVARGLCDAARFGKVLSVFQRLTIAVAFAAAVFAAGCTSSAPVIKPKGKSSIPVQTDVVRPEGKARLFDEVTVHLPPIKSPGSSWTIVLNDERYLEPRGPIVSEPDGGAAATFLALRAGRRTIRFFALPPGKEAVPTQRYEIRVSVEDAR